LNNLRQLYLQYLLPLLKFYDFLVFFLVRAVISTKNTALFKVWTIENLKIIYRKALLDLVPV